jgi:uncharacterized repeat protein (TIGR03803 family)
MRKIQLCALILFPVFTLVLAPNGVQGQIYTDLYNFGTNSGDPIQAQPAVIAQGRDGNLYSATGRGGTNSDGTVFKITPKGKLSLIYNFDGIVGGYPSGGLTLGTDGNLYGVTQEGGNGEGIVFKVTPAGNFTVLHKFASSDGAEPLAPPIQGANGNFYGTTARGGSSNYGTVYEMTPSGELTTLYSFSQDDGQGPIAALVQGTDGDFYGTTDGGGTSNDGTVFKITGTGKLTTLHMFDGSDGWGPTTALVQGADGDFYGTTTMGGNDIMNGTVFKIGSKGKFTSLYSFPYDGSGGIDPEGGLVLGTDGKFYGTAYQGGTNNNGTIYRITAGGNFSTVYTFDGTNGCCPLTTLVQHTSGVIFGDTYGGGTKGLGVAYSLNARLRAYAGLVPVAGKVGKTIGILGQGFKGTRAVSFNGTSATQFSVVSNTFLKATVPNGATTGLVTVTIPKGKLVSKEKFRVIP